MPQEIPIKILALDPGTKKFGYAIFNGKNMLVESKQIKFPKSPYKNYDLDLNYKLYFLYKTLISVLREHKVDAAVIEIPIAFRNTIIALSMCSAVLRIACMQIAKKLPVFRVAPTSVKSIALGKFKGRVPKQAIQDAMQKKFGKRFWEDEADAIAIGLAFFENKYLK